MSCSFPSPFPPDSSYCSCDIEIVDRRQKKSLESTSLKVEMSETKNTPIATTGKRRQTSLQTFFGRPANAPKMISFGDCPKSSSKRTRADFPMTPPTPVSPQTPRTPPDAPVVVASGTPPTEDTTEPEEIHLFLKKSKILPSALIADVSICSSRDSANERPTAASYTSTKHTRSLQQTYLDLGQSNFAKRTICSTCGMLFVHGLVEDSKDHAKICQDYIRGVPFSASSCRVVYCDKLGSIVEVRPSDSASLRNKVKRVKTIVDHDLGFSPTGDTGAQRTAYLYIAKNRVVGMATAEIIQSAYRLEASSSSRSTTSNKALAGIHQLWVHASVRKQGVATRLIDAVRAKLVFGLVVSAELLAFSSPTEAGARFAGRYARANHVKDGNVLVYDCY